MPSDSKESKAAAQNKADQKIAHLLVELSKLDRAGKIDVARAAAGLAGMVAIWPSEIGAKGKSSSGPPKKGGKPSSKKSGPKQAPNPLAGTPTYAAYISAKKKFDHVKKHVQMAHPDNSNEEVEGHESVRLAYAELTKFKEAYFRLKAERAEREGCGSEETSETASPVPTYVSAYKGKQTFRR
jgi:hypothetical protein